MSVLQQFINAGWHTVPLGGQLIRDANGKKSRPEYEVDWKNKYAREFNTRATMLGGALTGAVSGIVAVDCDTKETWDMIIANDPHNQFVFPSLGKPSGGGTIIYKYNGEIPTFKKVEGNWALEFFSDGGFIYLPTEHNYTKEDWRFSSLPELFEIPAPTLALLKMLCATKTITRTESVAKIEHTQMLAPILMDFMAKQLTEDKYSPNLFKIITPKSFRNLELYQKQKHLHPDSVPQGRGSEYLMSISAILGKDRSVSPELYMDVMYAINNLFSQPMDRDRLNSEIVFRMVNGVANIDGEVIWTHDKHWAKTGLLMLDKNGNYLEVFVDNVLGIHYLIDHSTPYVKMYENKAKLIKFLRSITGRPLTEAHFDSTIKLVRTVRDPSKAFGLMDDRFNLFRQTDELDVLNYPEAYAKDYKHPATTLRYLETLIPDPVMRNYTISFMRTKLTTFGYSPVVLYFIGVMGSGKDEFVNFFRRVLGDMYVDKPEPSVFLGDKNGYLEALIFLHLDEYGDRIKSVNERQEASGKIKTITGSQNIQIRKMYSDGYNSTHNITVIMTANKSPLIIDVNDRRIAYIKTPNILREAQWVKESESMQSVIDEIRAETKDFCYYLATQVQNLSPDAYQKPPDTLDKEQLILEGLSVSDRLAQLVKTSNFDELEALGEEYQIEDFTYGWVQGRLLVSKLKALYMFMTEGKSDGKVLTASMKNIGYRVRYTTAKKLGGQIPYYDVEPRTPTIPFKAQPKRIP